MKTATRTKARTFAFRRLTIFSKSIWSYDPSLKAYTSANNFSIQVILCEGKTYGCSAEIAVCCFTKHTCTVLTFDFLGRSGISWRWLPALLSSMTLYIGIVLITNIRSRSATNLNTKQTQHSKKTPSYKWMRMTHNKMNRKTV